MDLESQVHVSENGDRTVRNGGVSGKIEAFNGLAEGNNFSHLFPSNQLNRGHNRNLSASKMSELMKLGNLESASTESLFSVVKTILDESFEKKNEDIPQRVTSLLKLVVQEIENRVSKQSDDMKKQNNLCKSREDSIQSKIRALETLANGTTEENEVVMKQLQQMKTENTKMEDKMKFEDQDLIKLRKEKASFESEISSLKEEQRLANNEIEEIRSQLKDKAEETKDTLQKKILELEFRLTDSETKVKELENFSELNYSQWRRKEHGLNRFIDSQCGSLQELRLASESIKKEVLKMKNVYMDEFYQLGRKVCESGVNLEGLTYAAKDKDYRNIIEENRKLYNEVQDLKGNIRVYCRVRPFPNEQSENQTTVKYIGENGELAIQNPSKPSKGSPRLYKFQKVFAPAATQEEVFFDTQPLIKSVLDGYNVCIFAYGQTGSGKTYTMIGPNAASSVDRGVNYRALNDLFNISQNRCSSITYEIGVQMVEIYNEQVRDLLRSDNLQKKLGIWNTTQPNGLVVPDANMYPVNSTKDVIDLMNIGLTNRVVGATSLNERSSRSHSVLTVHVRGTELETNTVLRGCLHLVDLAGSERVDRSEATGDRLRESQHINKSLSALGDVIFALSQKSSHVPYRNSKLTQILQSSLGGQAKTLMFVHLNPDVQSYSETASTLNFAERVAGVELGAARSNKEGRGVRELMEQVASLKNSVAKKDEEIGRLRMLKTSGNNEKRDMNSPKKSSPRPIQGLSGRKTSSEKAISDFDNSSEYSEKQSEIDSQQSSNDEFKHHKEFFKQSRLVALSGGQSLLKHKGVKFDLTEDTELLGFGSVESEERLSDISEGDLSMGTETDGSICSIVEYTLFPEVASSSAKISEKQNVPNKSPRTPTKKSQAESLRTLLGKSSSKIQSSNRATVTSPSALKPSKKQK